MNPEMIAKMKKKMTARDRKHEKLLSRLDTVKRVLDKGAPAWLNPDLKHHLSCFMVSAPDVENEDLEPMIDSYEQLVKLIINS